jgi:serine/threonine-protein kinase
VLGGRYRVLRQLGAGGMGTVYLCEHVQLGRRYAVKVLNQGRSAEVEQRFLQEARAASRIDQENVIDVLDYGEDPDGELYYVMEALQGRSLTQVLREDAPLSVPRALALVEQVGRALAAAHARGVVHRDVKPDNVFVERLPSGVERAKLIDFGISHVPGNSRLTLDGEIIGTPEYMAPEQAVGSAVDPLSDVYAAGVLAYELLTGFPPLVGDTAVATLVAHQTRPPTAPSELRPGIPAEVDELVLRALAKRPQDRFSSMTALVGEVTRIRHLSSLAWPAVEAGSASPGPEARLAGSTLTMPAFPTGSQAPRARRMVAPGLVLAGLVLVVLLAVAAGLAWRHEAAAPPARPAQAAPPAVAAAPAEPAAAPAAAPTASPPPAPVPAPLAAAPPAPAPRPVARPAQRAAAVRPKPTGDDVKDPYAAEPEPLKANPFK